VLKNNTAKNNVKCSHFSIQSDSGASVSTGSARQTMLKSNQ